MKGFRLRAAAFALASLAAVLLFAACTIHQRAHVAARSVDAAAGNGLSVCVLFFDGLSAQAFQRLVDEGALPTIEAEILRRGLVVDTAVASVPSETYPNLAAMLTGLLPGHHGIPANIWLDRRIHLREAHTNIFRTYAASEFLIPQSRTLYERLPPDTVAVTSPLARGVTVHSKNIVALMASWARNDWQFLDRKTLDDAGDAYVGAATAGRLPPLVWTHILGTDEVAHERGPESAEFKATMVSVDRALARLVRRLKRRHLYERVLFCLIGDHGNSSYETYVDASELVHRALFSHPTEADCRTGDCFVVPSKRKKEDYDVGGALIAVGAYRGAMIWLPSEHPPEDVPTALRTRKGRGLLHRTPRPSALKEMPPTSAFAAALARLPELQLVVTRGEAAGDVEIYGNAGRSEIIRQERDGEESRYLYRVLEGADPLGYAGLPSLAPFLGTFLSGDDWLAVTISTEYPDLVVQLAEFFDSPRAPDVYVTPRAGFGFREGKAAGHGSLARSEMVVPLVFAGPGVTPGHLAFARTVDLAPTLLSYLGVSFDADDLDGNDLVIAPKAGGDAPGE
ncbi:MAG TPA: alkaline phosphatase family protein [Thermoanaerobaculia bacterium]|nr:alkaline phosphatase family protein [Thermoanaerobaculia bacterium]